MKKSPHTFEVRGLLSNTLPASTLFAHYKVPFRESDGMVYRMRKKLS